MSHHCHHHLPLGDSLLSPLEQNRLFRQLALSMITLGLIVLSLFWRYQTPDQPAISDILAGIATLLIALPVANSAWASLRYPDLHGVTDLLIALAMLGAWALGDLITAATLPVIMIFGHIIEERGVMGTRHAIEALSRLAHSRARRIQADGSIEETDNQHLKPGDIVEIRTGDNVPADGEIIFGFASLDTSSITGESVPREVTSGSAVYGGSINLSGLIRMRVTLTGKNATLGKVIGLMQDAEQAKPPITRLLEQYAGHYLILVLLLAATTWFLTYNSQAMLAVLVAACPCALVLSVPATSMAGITVAARNGILIRNAAFLEELADVDALIADKTGTLTQADQQLQDVIITGDLSEQQMKHLAACLGETSTHPVSQMLVKIKDISLPEWKLDNPQEIHGEGICAQTEHGMAILGKASLFRQYQISVPAVPEYDGPIVGLALDGQFLGWLLLADSVRPEAREALAELREKGIHKQFLLTGDRYSVAKTIAAACGIQEFQTDALPSDKLKCVQTLIGEGWHPMVIGDGINDALALKAGAVGIAMGKRGSDIAMASADIVLTSSDLRRLPFSVALSRACRKTLQMNIIIGLSWTVLIVGAAALGWLGGAGALLAAILHNLSTLLVLINSGRLLQFDKNHRDSHQTR